MTALTLLEHMFDCQAIQENSERPSSGVAHDEQGGILPDVSVAHRSSATGKRSTDCALDPGASPGVIERPGRLVLVEHPQVDGPCGPMLKESESGSG